jgi:hypothetical protein
MARQTTEYLPMKSVLAMKPCSLYLLTTLAALPCVFSLEAGKCCSKCPDLLSIEPRARDLSVYKWEPQSVHTIPSNDSPAGTLKNSTKAKSPHDKLVSFASPVSAQFNEPVAPLSERKKQLFSQTTDSSTTSAQDPNAIANAQFKIESHLIALEKLAEEMRFNSNSNTSASSLCKQFEPGVSDIYSTVEGNRDLFTDDEVKHIVKKVRKIIGETTGEESDALQLLLDFKTPEASSHPFGVNPDQ